MQQLQSLDELIEPIKNDLTAGASEIGLQAIVIFQTTLEGSEHLRLEELKARLANTAQRLIAAQPAMATLLRLSNNVLLAVAPAKNATQVIEVASQALFDFEKQLCASAELIANNMFDLIPYGELVFAHSFSSTVLSALLSSRARGKVFKVICTESRPAMEGRKLATLLAAGGVEVVHTFDNALALLLSECAVAFMGADAIGKTGLVNKVGSFPLASTCRELHIPLYSLAGTEKIVPEGRLLDFEKHERPGQEVWDDAPAGVSVLNLQFELVPFNMISGLVTEDGILRSEDMDRYLKNWKLDEALEQN